MSGRANTALWSHADKRLGCADDDSDFAPATEGDDGAHARAGPDGLSVVDLVREVAKERQREGDGDEHRAKASDPEP